MAFLCEFNSHLTVKKKPKQFLNSQAGLWITICILGLWFDKLMKEKQEQRVLCILYSQL